MSEGFARTPLFNRHTEAGAKMGPFAGFEMPVVYSSIVEEHRSVRSRAGLFDVSHMGEIRLTGPEAPALAQLLFTNDVAGMQVGRVRYGMLLDQSGGVVDDVMLTRVGERELFFCVNASNTRDDLAWICEVHRSSGLERMFDRECGFLRFPTVVSIDDHHPVDMFNAEHRLREEMLNFLVGCRGFPEA